MNISIIGMPASGKTTIAKALVKKLKGYKLIDIDEKIVQNEMKSINDIFAQNGEDYFRKIETDVLTSILQNDNQIISTGGGIVKEDKNIELLLKNSKVVYLKAKIETLVDRAKNNTDRPLLKDCDIQNKLKKLLKERGNKYNRAHLILEAEGKTPEAAADEIIGKIYENY